MEGHHINLIQEEEPQRAPRFSWRFLLVPLEALPIFLLIIAIILLFTIVFAGIITVPHVQALNHLAKTALSGKDSIAQAVTAINNQKFREAAVDLTLARDRFISAQSELSDLQNENLVLLNLPKIHGQVAVARDILRIGEDTTDALLPVVNFAADLLDIIKKDNLNFSNIDEVQRGLILKKLVDLGLALDNYSDRLTEINNLWTGVQSRADKNIWGSVLGPLKSNLPTVLGAFDKIKLVSEIVPAVVGYNQEKTYLFLLQNNDELRPSGGFIGTYGIVKVKNGNIISFKTDNIYNLDVKVKETLHVPPPPAIQKYLVQKDWFMRDANWSPDFPTAAQKVEEFYHLENGPEKNLDGVIAINPQFIERLLGLVGEIEVQGVKFNKDNFTDQLQYEVEVGFYKKNNLDRPEGGRKDIIGDLSQELQKRLFALPSSEWEKLFATIRQSFDEKYALGYFKNDKLEKFIVSKKWGGVVEYTPDDYLLIVDANLAALKTDRVMTREANYKISPAGKTYQAELTLNYKNNGSYDWRTSKYRSYTRLYLPEGIVLQDIRVGKTVLASDQIDIAQEFNKTVIGYFWEVLPGHSNTITVRYLLPERLRQNETRGDYKLLIQKQPGVPEWRLNLDLTFDKKIRRYENETTTNQVKFSDTLRQDQLYTINF